MNTINEELTSEFDRLKKRLEQGEQLCLEDFKIILLAQLAEENQNER